MNIEHAKDAYSKGAQAAIRGESLNGHKDDYKKDPDLWTRFQLGFLDMVRDMRRAKLRELRK